MDRWSRHDPQIETRPQYMKRMTEHLVGLPKGAPLINGRTQERGRAAKRIDGKKLYIEVILTDEDGKPKGKGKTVKWFARNARLAE